MRNFKQLPIKKKLTLIISGVNIFILVLVLAIYSIERISSLKKDLKSMAHAQARLIGEYCISPIVFDDIDGLREIVSKSETMDFINTVSVYNRSGKLLLYHTIRDPDEKTKNHLWNILKLNKDINIVENINHQENLLGYINLEINTDRLKKDILRRFVFFLIILLLLYLLVMFLARITQKVISEPIIALEKAVDKIAESKDYSLRLQKTQDDEIGNLYESFNSLIDQIDKQIKEKNYTLDKMKTQYDRFLSILDSFPEYIYIVDPETYNILFVNHSLSEAFGTKLVGLKCYNVLQGLSAPCSFCSIPVLKKENQSVIWEHYNPVLRKTFHVTDKLIRWPDGKLVKLEFANDVSMQKDYEMKIKSNEKRFYQIISQNPDAILILDESKIIAFANSSAERLFGKQAHELTGNSLEFQIDVENVTQKEIMRPHGEEAIVEIRTTSIEFEDQPAYLIILRDITTSVKDEAHKKSLEKQLQQSQKMESFGALAGGIAHDFNNILTVINGYCEMSMSLVSENDILYENLAEIAVAGSKASSLTRQLLAFSRNQVMDAKLINIKTLVEDLHKMLKRLISEDHKLVVDIEEDTCLIKADPGQIEQVLMNLVINARDASPIPGSAIKITAKSRFLVQPELHGSKSAEAGLYVVVSVEDSGVGMTPEVMERIFEPFFTTKKAGSGTGLGLSVVFGIIKQHNGWINAYSEKDKGTIFNIYLPAEVDAHEEQTINQENYSHYMGNEEKILFVEDEDNVRKVGVSILNNFGYSVIETADSKEAERIFREKKDLIDLVISDVVLPDDNGVELVKRLRKLVPNIKILLNSGYTARKINFDEINRYGFRFIQKPYQIIELLKIVRELLDEE